MRVLIVLALAASVVGCTHWSMDHHMNNAYRSYDRGNCDSVMLELSQVERFSRPQPNMRPDIQPEVSMLRGLCLERTKFFLDAAQTYQFIISQYPDSEYAFRARARLQTLEQLGHYRTGTAAVTRPAPL
jgi:outer membrane protein assembly factor BamD (BamD/ComL family)